MSLECVVISDDMQNVTQKCNGLTSQMDLMYIKAAPTLRFSNTGRRGEKKLFDISLVSLVQTLNDIYQNFDKFLPYKNYEEKQWRELFSDYLTDEAINALSTVQTLPLFTVISKILHVINNVESPYVDKEMPLTKDNLSNVIKYLESQIPEEEAYQTLIRNALINEGGHGENIIYYGAPGTGKSHAISLMTSDTNATRTVFHPDTQYSDFIGCLKPSMIEGKIQYTFRAGPFTEAVIRALKNSEQHYYLIIEEINRAPAAAVFGEIFQLLDRDAEGLSVYPVDIGDPDFAQYLQSQLKEKWSGTKLRIPSNLSILATMNSSDQAVMPMDTAFKRRWKFKYQKLNFENAAIGSLPLSIDGTVQAFEWRSFAIAVNQILAENGIPEDRHLGPWFINDDELKHDKIEGTLTGKVFMYLWDDVLRHGRSALIFNESIRTYGALVTQFEAKKSIFSEIFIKKLYETNDVPFSILDVDGITSNL